MTRPRRAPCTAHLTASAVLALAALGCASLPLPAHAFWGALGKAASSAGKAAGSAAGKTAGAAGAAGATGAAGEAATAAGIAGKSATALGDDAARAGGLAAGTADATGSAAHGFSAVNAALPPEVAVYLAKPATSLTGADTAAMMGLYERMVAQAGKTGDFSAIEHLPPLHGAKTLQQATPSSPVAAHTKAGPAAQASPSAAEINLAGLRLLAHAASAGHRGAHNELRTRCADPAVRRTAPDVAAQCKAALAAKPRPSVS